jgi:signal transduction histidine kinase
MLESEFLIYDRRASASHAWLAWLVAIILLLGCVAVFPYRLLMLPKIGAFIPFIDAMQILFSGIVAAVLLSMASVLRLKALIALGTGYFFTGLIALVYTLTYPDTFSRIGLLGARTDTAAWLYLAWHTALPATIIVYAHLKNSPHRLHDPARAPVKTIFVCLIFAAMAAACVTWLATAAAPVLTDLMKFEVLNDLTMLLMVGGIALLWFGQRSILDVALMLTLWALLLESALIWPEADRFSAGWYAGRVMGLLSGLFVLLMLLIDMSRLYARTVVLIAYQNRERENRLMVGEAVGASIAHELRQPLASMILNAQTAKHLGGGGNAQLSEVLNDLVTDSNRVNEIVESTRTVFGKASAPGSPANINQLIRDTLLITSRELRNHNIKVEMRLHDPLPPVNVNRLQMQQVFMNLFINAAEAMSDVADRPRERTIRSSRSSVGVLIRVEDVGSGITANVRERIFDAFFTTKKHGTGMGLSICRSVVQAHGGTIQVSPKEPFGTSFEICLPGGGTVQAPAVLHSEHSTLHHAIGR